MCEKEVGSVSDVGIGKCFCGQQIRVLLSIAGQSAEFTVFRELCDHLSKEHRLDKIRMTGDEKLTKLFAEVG